MLSNRFSSTKGYLYSMREVCYVRMLLERDDAKEQLLARQREASRC